jgi:hypothetical protein
MTERRMLSWLAEYQFLFPKGFNNNCFYFCVCMPRPRHVVVIPELVYVARILYLKLMKYYLEFRYIEKVLYWYYTTTQECVGMVDVAAVDYEYKFEDKYLDVFFESVDDLKGFKQLVEIMGRLAYVMPIGECGITNPVWPELSNVGDHSVWVILDRKPHGLGLYLDIHRASLILLIMVILRLYKSKVKVGDTFIADDVDLVESGYSYCPDMYIYSVFHYFYLGYKDVLENKNVVDLKSFSLWKKGGGDSV